MNQTVAYEIDVSQRRAHIYAVRVRFTSPATAVVLSLPCWIPGSYLVRDFARFVSGMRAHQPGQVCAVNAVDLSTWRIHAQAGQELEVCYEVYAFDPSVRAAFLDDHRGFFNATSLCVRIEGLEQQAHTISLTGLPPQWKVATAMPHRNQPSSVGVASQPWPLSGPYWACDYDELVDHPFELGEFWHGQFEAGGAIHECVVTGAWPSWDGDRLIRDMQRICATQIDFWHGPGGQAPFQRYVFMLHVTEDGYGGLEHRASTALIAARKDLPLRDDDRLSEGYVTLLGLISHEYFHAWNVKRLKPAELCPIDYQRANHTELLWFFEGFTSYYDDLMLLRAGLIDGDRYLKLLAKNWLGLLNMPGRYAQSVAQASFDAWGKYYRVDENTPNITVSYYSKGAMVALCLDLTLRRDGVGSLDDVMRSLWQDCASRYGTQAAHQGWPVTEALIQAHIHKMMPHQPADWWHSWVHGTDDLPIETLLQAMGIQSRFESQGLAYQWGLRLTEGPVTGCVIRSVLRDSGAQRTGLCAGDEIIAVNGWRIRRLEDAASVISPLAPVEFCVARGQRLLFLVAPEHANATQLISSVNCAVEPIAADAMDEAKQAQELRQRWWGSDSEHQG